MIEVHLRLATESQRENKKAYNVCVCVYVLVVYVTPAKNRNYCLECRRANTIHFDLKYAAEKQTHKSRVCISFGEKLPLFRCISRLLCTLATFFFIMNARCCCCSFFVSEFSRKYFHFYCRVICLSVQTRFVSVMNFQRMQHRTNLFSIEGLLHTVQ